MNSAIGMLETYGLLPAIEGLDSALKAANVALRSFEYVSGGLVAWFVEGEVGAVRVAVDAGKAAAARVGRVVSQHVIARPAPDIAEALPPPKRPGGRLAGTGFHRREFAARTAKQPTSAKQPRKAGDGNIAGKAGDGKVTGKAAGKNAVADTGENMVIGSGNNAVADTGENMVIGSGNNALAGRGENAMKGPGAAAIDAASMIGGDRIYTRDELESINVGVLRAAARRTAGVPMSRIEIRDAKKSALIDGLLKAWERTE